jgi:hypothetical protein
LIFVLFRFDVLAPRRERIFPYRAAFVQKLRNSVQSALPFIAYLHTR